jgi:hypothetical protein
LGDDEVAEFAVVAQVDMVGENRSTLFFTPTTSGLKVPLTPPVAVNKV